MIFNIVGWIGAILYLSGYLLLSIKKIQASSAAFQLFNLFGSLGVTVAACYNNDIPSEVLNFLWGVIAVITLIFYHSRKL